MGVARLTGYNQQPGHQGDQQQQQQQQQDEAGAAAELGTRQQQKQQSSQSPLQFWHTDHQQLDQHTHQLDEQQHGQQQQQQQQQRQHQVQEQQHSALAEAQPDQQCQQQRQQQHDRRHKQQQKKSVLWADRLTPDTSPTALLPVNPAFAAGAPPACDLAAPDQEAADEPGEPGLSCLQAHRINMATLYRERAGILPRWHSTHLVTLCTKLT